MQAYTPYQDGFSRGVEEMIDSIQAEIRHAAAYVDRVVVPEVRREAAGAARVLATHLDKLADKLHPDGKQRP
jgi:hypothetical protein